MKQFTIPYVGLKEGEHRYEYQIDRAFFEHFDYEDFNDINVIVSVLLRKKSTLMEFVFQAEGSVDVNCDVTNEPYKELIDADYELVVKFGSEYNDDFEDILILPYGEYEINIAHYIYELIVLALPNKRVHPGVEDGTLKSDILDKLEALSVKDQEAKSEKEKEKKETDPRWDTLKKLLTDK